MQNRGMTLTKLERDTENLGYNITKAKRAFWLVNSASTIYLWVYAADVLNN